MGFFLVELELVGQPGAQTAAGIGQRRLRAQAAAADQRRKGGEHNAGRVGS